MMWFKSCPRCERGDVLCDARCAQCVAHWVVVFWALFFVQVTALYLVNPAPITDAGKILVLLSANCLTLFLLVRLVLARVERRLSNPALVPGNEGAAP